MIEARRIPNINNYAAYSSLPACLPIEAHRSLVFHGSLTLNTTHAFFLSIQELILIHKNAITSVAHRPSRCPCIEAPSLYAFEYKCPRFTSRQSRSQNEELLNCYPGRTYTTFPPKGLTWVCRVHRTHILVAMLNNFTRSTCRHHDGRSEGHLFRERFILGELSSPL